MFENLSLKSLIRFKNEPALWGGTLLAAVAAGRDVFDLSGSWFTAGLAAVAAVVAIVVRGKVKPV